MILNRVDIFLELLGRVTRCHGQKVHIGADYQVRSADHAQNREYHVDRVSQVDLPVANWIEHQVFGRQGLPRCFVFD